jgi:hypothetical protein
VTPATPTRPAPLQPAVSASKCWAPAAPFLSPSRGRAIAPSPGSGRRERARLVLAAACVGSVGRRGGRLSKPAAAWMLPASGRVPAAHPPSTPCPRQAAAAAASTTGGARAAPAIARARGMAAPSARPSVRGGERGTGAWGPEGARRGPGDKATTRHQQRRIAHPATVRRPSPPPPPTVCCFDCTPPTCTQPPDLHGSPSLLPPAAPRCQLYASSTAKTAAFAARLAVIATAPGIPAPRAARRLRPVRWALGAAGRGSTGGVACARAPLPAPARARTPS